MDLPIKLSKDVQEFILANENTDVEGLVLKHKLIFGVPSSLVADQIAGRRKATVKIPTYYQTIDVLYPPSINLEQCSSELTARLKAKIIAAALHPPNLSVSTALTNGVDLTGGFGVDSFFLAQVCDRLDYVEPNAGLLEIARHNHHALGETGIHYHAMTAEAFLKSSGPGFDFIFIDPSRRSNSKKIFRLAECHPDVIRLLPSLLKKTDRLLVKTSPLLDLQQGIRELETVQQIFVVAADQECKEVLFLCSKAGVSNPPVTAVNLSGNSESDAGEENEFTFTFEEERQTTSAISDPLTYLFEPHSWILKAGAFKTLGHRYGLSKLAVSTHLYTSDTMIDRFPGRIFKIEDRNPKLNTLRDALPEGKANIFVRNYPLRPDQLKKKLKILDGGEKYLIGFSGVTDKFLVVATRVK